ncbi:universal stress protein [Uliginosibacterium sp. H3]|uniref:Universal stress protein n=1 Tax=Uliginosibacterium silvisoli TaxID=3114758 RepID=A0ABU6JZY5_9RHOO|nr:universal stress protein [Uliginosibacterium sp. H3]
MYKHLLVPTDGSDLSQGAVTQAVQLARTLDARITVLYVQAECPKPMGGEAFTMGPFREEFLRATAAATNAVFESAKSVIAGSGVNCKYVTATSDAPWEVIISTARSEACDLIFMASHGRGGIAGLLIGSQTHKVLAHCKVPVLVCR